MGQGVNGEMAKIKLPRETLPKLYVHEKKNGLSPKVTLMEKNRYI